MLDRVAGILRSLIRSQVGLKSCHPDQLIIMKVTPSLCAKFHF